MERARLQGKVLAWLRVGAVFVAVAALSLWWGYGRVQAELSERALAFGQNLEAASKLHAGTTRLRLNGQRLALNSQSTAQTVEQVLERFERACGEHSGGVRDELDRLLASRREPRSELGFRQLGVLRAEGGSGEGTAACFASDARDGLSGLIARVAAALDSGDLSRLGQFRYVFARKSQLSGTTHVISVWSEAGLDVEQMFPAQGDAPGMDIVPNVRPPRAQRILSADSEQAGFRSALYATRVSPAQAIASYDGALSALGYVPLAREALDGVSPVAARIFTLNDREQLVVLAQESKGQTLVSAFRLGSNGYVSLPL